jgi:hypothetical protein
MMLPDNIFTARSRYGSEAAVEVLENSDLEDLKHVSKRGWVTVVTRGKLVSFSEQNAAEEFARILKLLKQ